MRIPGLVSLVALLLALPVAAPAQALDPAAPALDGPLLEQPSAPEVPVAQPAPRPAPFSPGEELVYKITALGMTAGKARIAVGTETEKDGVGTWPVVVQARTDSLFDSIYTVRDRFVTWWHPASGRVVGADFFADEGGERRRSTSKLDHAAGRAEVIRIEESKGKRTKKNYEIAPGSYDIAGAIMALRARPLTPGSVEEIDVFTGKKVFKLRCTAVRTEKIKTGAGSFDAVFTKIELGFDGQFASKRDVLAWFSNDERHLPLRLEAEFVLGSVVADLVEAKRGISR